MRKSLLAIAALCAASSGAGAVGFMTQLSCANDYYAYCSQHSVGSAGLRQCMRAHGPRLSKSCIDALIADGEVSRAEVEREKAKLLAAKAKPKPKPAEPKPADVAAIKKPASATKTADAALKKPASVPQKAKVAGVPVPQTSSAGKPKTAAAAVPKSVAMVPPVGRNEATLDQKTYQALKSRGARFLAGDDAGTEIALPLPSDAAPQIDTQREPVSSASATPPATEPQVEAPADVTAAEPAPRPVPFPEARMSLGRNISASEPRSWWDELVNAVTGE
jgi:hypothetical protein